MSLFTKAAKFLCLGLSAAMINSYCVSAATIGKVTGNNVNVRSLASSDSSIISKVNQGQTVSVMSNSNGWYKVALGSTGEAYITGEYINITQADGTVNSSNVNIRTDPSTTAGIAGKANSGQVLEATGKTGDWYRINYNGTTAYIYKDFIAGTFLSYLPNVGNTTETSSSSKGADVVNYAKQFLGTPYVYGGTNLNTGVDCSGFVYCVYKSFGINLNRSSRDQISNGTRVDKANLQMGDLVFFNTGGNSQISHVGIYIGNNQYIHSTDSKNQGVTISSLSNSYSSSTYVGACRVLK